jgi:hypothetical protein
MKVSRFCPLPPIVLVFLSLCGDRQNPYLASNDSGVRITSKSFGDGDTISIFSTESLAFVLHLKEHLDHITLQAPANRLWPKQDTVITAERFDQEPFIFRFSFFDTGRQEISITAKRARGDSVRTLYGVTVRSPLHQAAVNAGIGDTVLLTTPAVGDDALYIWDFGDGIVVKNNVCHAAYIVKTPLWARKGELYVADLVHRSPSAVFSIIARGKDNPRIIPLGDSIRSDTIFAGAAVFLFRAAVTGASSILAATVDGAPFERVARNDSGTFVFSKLLRGLDGNGSPMRTIVSITDGSGADFERIFWIVYNPALPRPDRPLLRILFPQEDSLSTNTPLSTIRGFVANRSGFDSLAIFLMVNDSLHLDCRRVTADSAWQWTFGLAPGWNRVSVIAFEDASRQGETLAVARRAILYAPAAADTMPPRLITLLGNGRPLIDGQIIEEPHLAVRAEFFDNGFLDSVSINAAPAAADSSGAWFSAEISLTHRLSGTPVHVRAVDRAGNACDRLMTLWLDRAPIFSSLPAPSMLPADSIFSALIGITDLDEDSVSLSAVIHCSRSDSLLRLGAGRALAWRPAPADTGWRRIELRAWDGYVTVQAALSLFVYPPRLSGLPVKFLTGPGDFPDTLVAAEDTLRMNLRVLPQSGTPPLRFDAVVDGGPPLLANSTSPLLLWTPAEGDTGIRGISAVVHDSLGFTDSVKALMTVVPASRPAAYFESTHASGPESVPAAALRVRLSEPSRKAVMVAYCINQAKTSADSADFSLPADRHLVFSPGETAREIVLSIVNDTLVERDDTIALSLVESGSQAIIGARSTATYTVLDDDKTVITFADSVSWGSESVSPRRIAVQCSRPVDQPITVGYFVDGSSSANGADYHLDASRTVTFASQQTSQAITVGVVDDYIMENEEQIILRLVAQSPLSVLGDRSTHACRIIDNDVALQVTVTPSGSGTVMKTVAGIPNDGPYSAGTVVDVTAKPAPGYLIGSWNGPVMATANPEVAKIRMDSSVSIIAAFKMAPPVIVTQPSDVAITEGLSALFSIAAYGLNLGYQWQRNQVPIPGAAATTYSTPGLSLSDNGVRYRCVVSNQGGSVVSREAIVTVASGAPVITMQPRDTGIDEGRTATFRVAATGSGLSYQWQKNGLPIASAISAGYTTPAATIDDSGAAFRCIVASAAHSVTSAGAILSVRLVPPKITAHPSSQNVIEGGSAKFSIVASGSRLSYQWKKNGTDIGGAAASLYTVPRVSFSDSGSSFTCLVRNGAGAVTSSPGVLNVLLAPPVVTSDPSDQTVNEGQQAVFSAAVQGSKLTLQWQKNGIDIPAATTTSYTISSAGAADSGSVFRLVASNGAGKVTTAGAVLRVARALPALPVITTHPAAKQVEEGEPVSFSVTASGTGLTYQWTRNTETISGANGSTYSIAAAVLADSGAAFRCTVTNAAGSVTSNAAVLTVRRSIPVIVTNPSSISVYEGEAANFSVLASGGGLSYRWQRAGSDIPAANGESYRISAAARADSGAAFRCIVANAAGLSDTSAEAILTVLPPHPVLPTVSGPVSTTVTENESAAFTVTVTGGTQPITLQWQKNRADLPGATNATYSIDSVQLSQDGEFYRCIATNPAGSKTSASARLTVRKADGAISFTKGIFHAQQ